MNEIQQAGEMGDGQRPGKPNTSGRVAGKNSEYRSGTGYLPKKLHNEIHELLHQNKDKAAHKEKRVGQRTQDIRCTVIEGFFKDLLHLKYNIESVRNVREKHFIAVFNFLESKRQSASTIQNKISVMRVFCSWIGKNGMIRDSTYYVKDDSSVARLSVAKEDKSWDGNGVDILAKLPEIKQEDETVALILELCWAFGLRVKEATMLRPSVAHATEGFLVVREGTKGDRERIIPIENGVQMNVLDRAKEMADKKTGFLGERGKTLTQKLRRFYHVMEKCGITLSEGQISAHGLRHQYMHDAYRRLLGVEPPIKGGDVRELDPDKLHVASQQMAELAGHSRPSITTAYYGSLQPKRPDGQE